jgi:hypothetical protein
MLTRRREVRRYYRHLRTICTRHHTAVMPYIARAAVLEQARRLRLAVDGVIVADSTEELTLLYDLAIYTAKPGRSRAIERYAKMTQLSPECDELRVLEAMCSAQFSIWRVERGHHIYGLIVTDLLREMEIWLVDEALTISARNGLCFAGRLCHLQHFTITNGVAIPILSASMERLVADAIARRQRDLEHASRTANLAAEIYRAALDDKIVDRVLFK